MTDEPPTWKRTILDAGVAAFPAAIKGPAEVLIRDVRARAEARRLEVAAQIIDSVGEDVAARRFAESDEVAALAVNAVEAAERTGHEAKRRMLGRLVSAAVLDDAKTDESTLLFIAVRDLEAPHFLALEQVRRRTEEGATAGDTTPLDLAVEAALVYAGLAHAPSSGLSLGDIVITPAVRASSLTPLGRLVLLHLKAD